MINMWRKTEFYGERAGMCATETNTKTPKQNLLTKDKTMASDSDLVQSRKSTKHLIPGSERCEVAVNRQKILQMILVRLQNLDNSDSILLNSQSTVNNKLWAWLYACGTKNST